MPHSACPPSTLTKPSCWLWDDNRNDGQNANLHSTRITHTHKLTEPEPWNELQHLSNWIYCLPRLFAANINVIGKNNKSILCDSSVSRWKNGCLKGFTYVFTTKIYLHKSYLSCYWIAVHVMWQRWWQQINVDDLWTSERYFIIMNPVRNSLMFYFLTLKLPAAGQWQYHSFLVYIDT